MLSLVNNFETATIVFENCEEFTLNKDEISIMVEPWKRAEYPKRVDLLIDLKKIDGKTYHSYKTCLIRDRLDGRDITEVHLFDEAGVETALFFVPYKGAIMEANKLQHNRILNEKLRITIR